MRAVDASSIIHGWDNYPIDQFPRLWDWMGAEVSSKRIAMCRVALSQVEDKSAECGDWLHTHGIRRLTIGNAELRVAQQVKDLLRIADDKYHPDGVDESDILIIASAKFHSAGLVSDENRQPSLPKEMWKYKIPAVCALPGVRVDCINFLDYIKQSKRAF